VADYNNHKIRIITPGGVVKTFAGSGDQGAQDGMGEAATFNHPSGIAVDSLGNIYVADTDNNKIRKITPDRIVTTFAGSGSIGSDDGQGASASFYSPRGITVSGTGNVYVADTNNHKLRKITAAGFVSTVAGTGAEGSDDGLGSAASFYYPYDVAVGAPGALYVADSINNLIRKITWE
jgi:sugar lactone lactonase YvrE